MMDKNKILEVLEFDKVLEQIAECAVSEPTRDVIKKLVPLNELEEVKKLQRLTHEAYLISQKYLLRPVVEFDDATQLISKAVANSCLLSTELLKVGGVLRSARIAKSEIAKTGDDIQLIKQKLLTVYVDENLEKNIYRCIAPDGTVRDDASETLRLTRKKIVEVGAKLKDSLQSFVRSPETAKFLQDSIVTVRSGRFVLPVKSECRGMIKGLIHDKSSTGATVFIEPYVAVDLNNELKYLQIEEQNEIERILLSLTEAVAVSAENVKKCYDLCITLDIIYAKLAYSIKIKGISPILNDKGKINLVNARHPLIPADLVVPVSVSTGTDYKILVITGPNTGGKTVCLKMVGLCCMLAAIGVWLPCDNESEISVFDNIFCDLGDEQSIENSLSTFSAHVNNVINITNNVTNKSLVLMDELGAGTDPVEGAALSLGIIKYLELMQVTGIITTHFDELKEYALISNNLTNACMQFDERTLKPTYKLVMGVAGVSNALTIASTLGLNDYIIKEARQFLSEEHVQFNKVLEQAEIAKSNADHQATQLKLERELLREERDKITQLRKQYEDKIQKINGNAKAETRRIVTSMIEQAEDLMQQLKDTLAERNEKALLEAKRLTKQLLEVKPSEDEVNIDEFEPIKADDVAIGLNVYVKPLRSIAVIESLPDRKKLVSVRVGSVKTNVKISDLAVCTRDEIKPKKKINAVTKRENSHTGTVEEIMVIGMTVAEAINVIEPYILSNSGNTLRIVHGKGTGKLGKGIQNYLKSNVMVRSFRYGGYGEGDLGVTICELK